MNTHPTGLRCAVRQVTTPRLNSRGHRLGHAAPVPLASRRPQRPPASARPAHGGRFSPAGSGAGLWHCVPDRFRLTRRERAGRGSASPFPARARLRRPVGCVFTRTVPPALAKAIAFATSQRRTLLPVAPKAAGQRLPCPRQALLACQVRRRPVSGALRRSCGSGPLRAGKGGAFPFPPEPAGLSCLAVQDRGQTERGRRSGPFPRLFRRLLDRQRHKARITVHPDQQQDRLAAGLFRLINPFAEVRKPRHRALAGLDDQDARHQPLGGGI